MRTIFGHHDTRRWSVMAFAVGKYSNDKSTWRRQMERSVESIVNLGSLTLTLTLTLTLNTTLTLGRHPTLEWPRTKFTRT